MLVCSHTFRLNKMSIHTYMRQFLFLLDCNFTVINGGQNGKRAHEMNTGKEIDASVSNRDKKLKKSQYIQFCLTLYYIYFKFSRGTYFISSIL